MNREYFYKKLFATCFALLPLCLYGQVDGKYRLRLFFDRIENHGNSMGHIDIKAKAKKKNYHGGGTAK